MICLGMYRVDVVQVQLTYVAVVVVDFVVVVVFVVVDLVAVVAVVVVGVGLNVPFSVVPDACPLQQPIVVLF